MEDYTEFLKTKEKTDLQIIREIVESEFKVDLSKRKRNVRIVDMRRFYSMLCRKYTFASYESIGEEIGKNHATIIHLCNTGEELLKNDKYFKEQYSHVQKLVPNFKDTIKRYADNQLEDRRKFLESNLIEVEQEIKLRSKQFQK